MGFIEIALLGIALSMDACAIAMTNGMTNVSMRVKGAAKIGLFFGVFQFLMPLIGFFVTGFFAEAFLTTVQKISSWVSFALLAFLGGKMLLEGYKERKAARTESTDGLVETELTTATLFMQAVATSIDALAVGVTLQMEQIARGLQLGVWGSCAVIGAITFVLSVAAVYIGKLVGNKLTDKASFLGGAVLIGIGIKLLLEGIL